MKAREPLIKLWPHETRRLWLYYFASHPVLCTADQRVNMQVYWLSDGSCMSSAACRRIVIDSVDISLVHGTSPFSVHMSLLYRPLVGIRLAHYTKPINRRCYRCLFWHRTHLVPVVKVEVCSRGGSGRNTVGIPFPSRLWGCEIPRGVRGKAPAEKVWCILFVIFVIEPIRWKKNSICLLIFWHK